jgi:hypothetical protein
LRDKLSAQGFAMRRLILAILVLASTMLAQEFRGSIRGRILDPSGAAAPEATFEVINAETNVKTTAVSNEAGNYLGSVPAAEQLYHPRQAPRLQDAGTPGHPRIAERAGHAGPDAGARSGHRIGHRHGLGALADDGARRPRSGD